MSKHVVITQTQTNEQNIKSASANLNHFPHDMRDPVSNVETKCFLSNKKGDSLYGIARNVPDKALVAARKEAGRHKTSIECVVGQRQIFKQVMAETTQKRQAEWNPDHDEVVAKWRALLPQPRWDIVLGNNKRRTQQIMYVADKKKQKVDEKRMELAAGYYECDK